MQLTSAWHHPYLIPAHTPTYSPYPLNSTVTMTSGPPPMPPHSPLSLSPSLSFNDTRAQEGPAAATSAARMAGCSHSHPRPARHVGAGPLCHLDRVADPVPLPTRNRSNSVQNVRMQFRGPSRPQIEKCLTWKLFKTSQFSQIWFFPNF